MNISRYFTLSCICLILLTISGCGRTPQSVYYTLSSIEDDTGLYTSTAALNDIAVGIGQIKFPDELEKPSIVTQFGQNQLMVNEIHRWGGSLKKNFTQILVENLAHLIQTDKVMARPWERYFKPDYRITMDVQQFGGRLGEYALLKVTWAVIETEKESATSIQRTFIKEPVTDSSYASLVAAQSIALAGLSLDIAATLRSGQ